MNRNIDTALVRAFLAVIETGSVTRAAVLLNLTQAAVSQQVKRLEELFGMALFERVSRTLRPTPAGERLVAHAQRLVALNDEVWGLMSAPDYEGEVRVGVPWDIVNPNMPPVLKRFDRTWPRVRVTLVAGITVELLQQLKRGELDLTLTTERGVPEHAEELLRDPLVWAGAAGGDAHARNPLPISLGDPSCAFRAAALGALTKAGRDWRPVSEARSHDAVKASLLADIAVAPMLRSSLSPGLQAFDPRCGLPMLPDYHINLYLRRTHATPIAQEFAKFVRQEFAARYDDRRRQARLDVAHVA